MQVSLSAILAAALLTGFAANATAADDALLKRAEQLIAAHKSTDAYELLKPEMEARAGEPQFDYLLGVACLDSGKPTEAVFALERVIDSQPDNAKARAELARAYYELGENDAAKEEFSKVEAYNPPAGVQQTIDRYMSAIEQRLDTTRTRYNIFVESGFGYDSNVNSATDNNQVVLPGLGGLVFTLSSLSRARESGIWDIKTGANFSSPLRSNLTLFGGASLDHRLAVNDGQFTQFIADGNLGLQLTRGDDAYRFSAQAQRFDVGGTPNRELGGFTGQWQRKLSDATQVTAFGQFALISFPDQSVRDVNRYTGGVGGVHAFGGKGSPVVYASAFAGIEDEQHSFKNIGRTLLGGRVGGQYTFNARTVGFASLDYQHSFYGGKEPLFAENRDEDFVSVGAGVRYAFFKSFTVRPEIAYSVSDSTIPIFSYDRWTAIVTFRNDF